MHQVAARVSAARTGLELALYLGPNSVKGSEEGSLCEITPVQLSSLFERWEDEQMSITEYVIPL